MPVVIDGNNLLHATVGARDRGDVRRQALESVRNEGMDLTVVFDGPPPSGSPVLEHLGRVTVHYAGGRSADEVILQIIPNGPRATEWVVVTDDRELRDRARGRGARIRSLSEWRRRRVRRPVRATHEAKLSPHDVADWEAFFARNEDED